MKQVLITGGSGLVGNRLSILLLEKGYNVAHLGRSKGRKNSKYKTYQWDIKKGTIDSEAITGSDFIIHLAGTNLFEGRWTENRKKEILESRTKSTELLVNKLEELKHPLKAFVSASAIGYYGNRGANMLKEDDEGGSGFLADVCAAWERAARAVTRLNIRLVINRTGIVLSTKGGALVQLKKPLMFGVGSFLGDGQEYYSWIHIDDLCQMYIKAIEDDSMAGVFNAVAPNPVHNKDLVTALATVLKKPVVMMPAPAPLLKFLLGEAATAVLDSIRVSSEKIEDKGFQFEHPWVEEALEDLVKRKV